MYKYYEKNGYKVMYYRFDSITEYVDYLINTPIKRDIFKKPESIFGDYSFCKTNNFEEAIELIKYGYHKDFDKFIELKMDLEKYIKYSNKINRQYNYYAGYVPDVKAYLEGNPLSMLNKSNNIKKKVDIYFNSAVRSNISSDAIFNRGAIVLTLIQVLESRGIDVDFHLFTMSEKGNEIHFADFIFKKFGERANPKKLFFPLCHPSWMRRLIFRLREVTPDISSSWCEGYGYACKLDTIKKIIDLDSSDIVIPTIQELNIKGEDIIDDANSLFNYINSLGNDDVQLKKVEKIRRI